MTAPEPTRPADEHTDAVALERRHREAGAECALWNQANLVGQAIDRGRLDGTDGAAVAAAIRARTPEEFAKACGEVSPTAEHIDAVRCPECQHMHTPDGCTGPPSPSDIWAGVSVSTCDCDEVAP